MSLVTMSMHNIISSIVNGVVLIYFLLLVPYIRKWYFKNQIFSRYLIFVLFILVLAWLPVYHRLTIVEIMRGIWGDLSITSIFILTPILLSSDYAKQKNLIFNNAFIAVTASVGLILYLSVLGIFKFDIYSFGYYPNLWMLLVIVTLEIFFWYFNRMVAWIWLLALIAFYFKLQSSINLWDYLFDPVLWLITICMTLSKLLHYIKFNWLIKK